MTWMVTGMSDGEFSNLEDQELETFTVGTLGASGVVEVPTMRPLGLYGPVESVKLVMAMLQGRYVHAWDPGLLVGQAATDVISEAISDYLENDEPWSRYQVIAMYGVEDPRVIPVDVSSQLLNRKVHDASRLDVRSDRSDLAHVPAYAVPALFTGPDELKEIWSKHNTLEYIVRDAHKRASLKFGIVLDDSEVGKTADRWTLFPAALRLYARFPPKSFKLDEWLHALLDRYDTIIVEGVSFLQRESEGMEIYAGKTLGLMQARAKPGFTAMGKRTSHAAYDAEVKIRLEDAKKDLRERGLVLEADLIGDSMGGLMGGSSPSWIVWDMLYMPAGTFKLQRQTPVYPQDAVDYAVQRWFSKMGHKQLDVRHLAAVTAGSASNGIRIPVQGSAGFPFLNMERKDVMKLTSERKARKGTVIRPVMRILKQWIDAGLPVEGPFWDMLLDQCRTGAHTRSDRQVSLKRRVLAELDPFVAMLLEGRLVLIASSIVTTGQSTVTQDLQIKAAQTSEMGYDVGSNRVTRSTAQAMVRRSESEVQLGTITHVVGADVTLFGENLSRLQRALELHVVTQMLPDDFDLLILESDTPLVLREGWEKELFEMCPPGGEIIASLPGPADDAQFAQQDVVVSRRRVNMQEFYLKVNLLLEHAPMQFGAFTIRGTAAPVELPGLLPEWFTVVGGRRHGDANTLLGNCIVTDLCLDIGSYIVNHWADYPEFHHLVAADHPFHIPGFNVEVRGRLIRGDDSLMELVLSHDVDVNAVMAGLLNVTGQMASASKQEASGIPGRSAAGVSSRLYTNAFSEGFTDPARYAQRSYTTENAAEYFPELADDIAKIISPVETIISRSLVMMPGLLGDALPTAEEFIHLVQDNSPDMLLFDGTEKYTEAQLLRAAARRHALRQLRRGSITEKQVPEVEEEFLAAQVMPKLKLRAEQLGFQPERRLPNFIETGDAFDEIVEAIRGGMDWDAAYRHWFGSI